MKVFENKTIEEVMKFYPFTEVDCKMFPGWTPDRIVQNENVFYLFYEYGNNVRVVQRIFD